jgi:hypothetical protein
MELKKTVESQATTPRKPTARSRVTNGHCLLPGIDGRSATARRYHDIIAALCSDAGGDSEISEARRQLIRRFSALSVLAENLEAQMAMGEPIDLAEHSLLSSTLVRIANRIGLSRHARTVPTLRDYLEARAASPAEAAP